jgi:tRNA A-37 threonylcarbamoyl transferase component Bud32
LTPDVANKIEKAFQELHKLGVLHGDIRAANIIVAAGGSIYIVDYELARVVSDVSDVSGSTMFESEELEVKQLLHDLSLPARERLAQEASLLC